MKFPAIKAPLLVNILIAAISGFVSWFGLLFGIAHLIEERNPDIPESEHMKGVMMAILLTGLGFLFLLLAIAGLLGIIKTLKKG